MIRKITIQAKLTVLWNTYAKTNVNTHQKVSACLRALKQPWDG